MRNRVRQPLLLAALAALLVGAVVSRSFAKLDNKTWRDVQARAQKTFGKIGKAEAKAELVAKLVEDADRRSWKMLVDAVVKEAEAWTRIEKGVRAKQEEISSVQSKPMAKRFPADQDNLRKWQEEIVRLEKMAREQREAYATVNRAVAEGPVALRKNLLNRAKGPVDWPVRAAAARVAALHPGEKDSFRFLTRVLEKDADARVRMAALEAFGELAREGAGGEGDPAEPPPEEGVDLDETVQNLILGRLADTDWGVQLLAVRILDELELKQAVPHLINGLSYASPRVAEAMGESLRRMTGQNFDPYADVWAKWWENHKEEFQSDTQVKGKANEREFSDVHFYGLPVRSDRVLFIIDASASMKLKTENENPAEKWKPEGPVTGPGNAPPPPPPEEILSGPKIDVAKHELKKALRKLPPTAKFNLIAFNSAVLKWKDKMMDASDKNKQDALKWVRALGPKGSTYIDGALREAFRIAGIGAMDEKYADVNVDTMVLLSDGAPTDDGWPDAKNMEPEVILQHVREWNRYKRVVIHTIGIDMQPWIEFLKVLAAENGGKYVDR